jgi:phosphoserine phosphatase
VWQSIVGILIISYHTMVACPARIAFCCFWWYKQDVPIRIAFFDCDGTLTTVKSSWEYLHRRFFLWDNNADHYQKLFREGRIDYHEFCRRDALLWRGLPVANVRAVVAEIPYQEGALEAVQELGQLGIVTVIVSTGLSIVVDRVRAELGIDMAVSNELLVEDGYLTGAARIHVEYEKKGGVIADILGARGLSRQEACAIGDGDGDIDMFRQVSLPIGFRPTESVLPHVRHAFHGNSLEGIVKIIRDGHSP